MLFDTQMKALSKWGAAIQTQAPTKNIVERDLSNKISKRQT